MNKATQILQMQSISAAEVQNDTETVLFRLPHPYQTSYVLSQLPSGTYQIRLNGKQKHGSKHPPQPLHHPDLSFTGLVPGIPLPKGDNTPYSRARASPSASFDWTSITPPTVGQLWLLIYAVFTRNPSIGDFRLSLAGTQTDLLRSELQATGLAVPHPCPSNSIDGNCVIAEYEIIILRSTFWQGAGSPLGPRPIWLPEPATKRAAISSFPILPLSTTLTTKFPAARVHALHPVRPAKPPAGSVVYSRFIPHLNENFSMIAIDWQNPRHLKLFNTWQNDPRVSAGWNEEGTLEEHRSYLKKMDADPHQFAVLACFEDKEFAYFEIYWGKEDHLGAYYDARPYDRGRHSLVGDASFRGPHRVTAWWSSLMHYLFLDEPRTEFVVGEPKATNDVVLMYDAMHGFNVQQLVHLPHKTSAMVNCPREKFFQLCPLGPPVEGRAGVGYPNTNVVLEKKAKL